MTSALFGKLPAKRDFISLNAPPWLLRPWETWLQSAISASRERLGAGWQDVYLQAPLWRFWLGEGVLGRTVMGSLMPSMDGVGRYFPLTLLAWPEDGRAFASPAADPQNGWFTAIESFMLDTLEREADFDLTTELFASLPVPAGGEITAGAAGITDGLAGLVAMSTVDGPDGLLALIVAEDARRRMAHTSLWWTVGGESYAPAAFMAEGLPDPYAMVGFLSGKFVHD